MKVAILGIRGIPAAHGGFETFAEYLALHLVGRGVDVTVYCQSDKRMAVDVDHWRGVRRVHIGTWLNGSFGTMEFDWRSISHADSERPDVVLVLGYNTAVFTARLRIAGIPVVMNMDGIEWKRSKWGRVAKLWFWLNEYFGCLLSDCLVADHPEIMNHLSRHKSATGKIEMIPYGAPEVSVPVAEASECLGAVGVSFRKFYSVVARAEPENSILEIVTAFSRRARGVNLLVLGGYNPDGNEYHKRVMDAASEEVVFAGAIYDKATLESIRSGSIAYIHGHTVGGTNPSLVEALGAGSAVLAHSNVYNRWVAENAGIYFGSADELSVIFDRIAADESCLFGLREAAMTRFARLFTWPGVLSRYEEVLDRFARA